MSTLQVLPPDWPSAHWFGSTVRKSGHLTSLRREGVLADQRAASGRAPAAAPDPQAASSLALFFLPLPAGNTPPPPPRVHPSSGWSCTGWRGVAAPLPHRTGAIHDGIYTVRQCMYVCPSAGGGESHRGLSTVEAAASAASGDWISATTPHPWTPPRPAEAAASAAVAQAAGASAAPHAATGKAVGAGWGRGAFARALRARPGNGAWAPCRGCTPAGDGHARVGAGGQARPPPHQPPPHTTAGLDG